ncbi:Retrovirus-related Pol polyprotein from transposon TNT 1-94 [Cardamine amara subsp. amara]|uniref:Retrovirus-related Pol polyprotein from transposon TNT 1-94 n=1 Tax=Cardamine amara subsp. amara TaxID=228776 RepID=A0ABD0ZNJ5_CARAN
MDGSKSIDQNVDDFLKTVSELASVKVTVTDEVHAILLLSSLPPQYDSMKETLKYSRESIYIEDVVNAAKSKETELKAKGISTSQNSGEAYVARGRQQNRDQRNSGNRGRSRSKSGTKVTCWFCKKEQHVKADCYAWKKRNGGDDEDAMAAVVIEQSAGVDALSVSENWHQERWVIDSGCSYHMTSRRDWFDTFEELNSGQVLLGDDYSVEDKGIGSININACGGTVKTLNNVRYIPKLKRNLISTSTLDKLGFDNAGGKGKTRFYKNGKMGLQGTLFGSLYLLDGETVVGHSNMSVTGKSAKDEMVLWHRRLGHMSMKNLMILVKRGIIDKRRIGEMDFYESCVMGKTKRLSFNIGKHNSGEALKYVHSDLWGSPSVTPRIYGKQYFLSIIDDYTRKVWVFFLSVKSEAFTKFCEWKKLVENQINKKVKCLRTDNGLEFVNKDFDGFCKQHGIERHKTCAYTPQQNGVAERMNRTIMEKVRCILDESGLGEEFWAEAVSTAVYQINRSPSLALDGGIPEELWLGRKPGYGHMRRFRSLVYVHVDQGKLRPRALKGVFISYPEGGKGYKVWLLDESKCVISRNVVFVEETVFKDLKNKVSAEETAQGSPTSEGVSIDTTPSVDRHGYTKDKTCMSSAGVSIDTTQRVDRHEDAEESDATTSEDNGQVESSGGVVGNLETDDVPRVWPKRVTRQPEYLNDYELASFALIAAVEMSSEEPRDYQEAVESRDKTF